MLLLPPACDDTRQLQPMPKPARLVRDILRRPRPSEVRPPLTEPTLPYEAHLAAKAERVWASLAQHVTGARRQVIASAPRAFRHKCGFGVWRARPGTGPVGYAMVLPATGGKVRVADDQHFAASADIQLLMPALLGPLNDTTAAAREARRGLCTFTFYSTLDPTDAAERNAAGSCGQTRQPSLVALGYNRPLGEVWRTGWAQPTATALGVTIVGRGPAQVLAAAALTAAALAATALAAHALATHPAQERRVAGGREGGLGELVQWFDVGGIRYPQHRRDGIAVQRNTALTLTLTPSPNPNLYP